MFQICKANFGTMYFYYLPRCHGSFNQFAMHSQRIINLTRDNPNFDVQIYSLFLSGSIFRHRNVSALIKLSYQKKSHEFLETGQIFKFINIQKIKLKLRNMRKRNSIASCLNLTIAKLNYNLNKYSKCMSKKSNTE